MRIHKLYQCFAAAVLLFLLVACDNTDYSEKSPFDNSAYLNVAASKNTETFTFNRKVTSQTKTFTVKLSYPAGDDSKVSLKVDPSLVGVYNAKNDTHYEMLPAEHYQLSQESVTIPAGKKEAAIMLDITYKKSIDGLGISGSKPGTVCVKSLVLEEMKR